MGLALLGTRGEDTVQGHGEGTRCGDTGCRQRAGALYTPQGCSWLAPVQGCEEQLGQGWQKGLAAAVLLLTSLNFPVRSE